MMITSMAAALNSAASMVSTTTTRLSITPQAMTLPEAKAKSGKWMLTRTTMDLHIAARASSVCVASSSASTACRTASLQLSKYGPALFLFLLSLSFSRASARFLSFVLFVFFFLFFFLLLFLFLFLLLIYLAALTICKERLVQSLRPQPCVHK